MCFGFVFPRIRLHTQKLTTLFISQRSRYGDGWLKISQCDKCCRGGCVRAFPKVNRVLNLIAFFIIAFMALTLWMFKTCADALNAFSEQVLYGTLSLWMGFVVLQYVGLCVGGSYLRAKFPEDMPFREPVAAIDRGPNATICLPCKILSCCYVPANKQQQLSVKCRLCMQGTKVALNKWGGP